VTEYARPDRWTIGADHRLALPESARSICEFKTERVNGGPGGWLRFIGIPLWSAEIPCLLLPGIWLRKRMRRGRNSVGFAVQSLSDDAGH
jgi:hypothetical protein